MNKYAKKYLKMHYNQILSYFNKTYPTRLQGKDKEIEKNRRKFRKIGSKYTLNENGCLCIINPLNNKDEINKTYKIPLINEKNILVNHIH